MKRGSHDINQPWGTMESFRGRLDLIPPSNRRIPLLLDTGCKPGTYSKILTLSSVPEASPLSQVVSPTSKDVVDGVIIIAT